MDEIPCALATGNADKTVYQEMSTKINVEISCRKKCTFSICNMDTSGLPDTYARPKPAGHKYHITISMCGQYIFDFFEVLKFHKFQIL